MIEDKHPEHDYEIKRLNKTVAYIDKVLDATQGNKDNYKANIRQALEDLDFLDSSQSYINILTNAKFMEMAEKSFGNLKHVRNKPYFCRIDFQHELQNQPDKIYIGKASLFRDDNQQPIIVDWRSPIANLYYEGRLGNVKYETEAGTVEGNLKLKRQYTIQDAELQEIRDIDITARDELLQSSLHTSNENRLKEIVATIQAEQNQVIRADMRKPLIVQGVAGSGKTTIALHRIAYFIYTYAEHFDPDQFMILAPNQLFLNYIADVLPELGVDQVQQTTFTDFVQFYIGGKYKQLSPDDKLLILIQEQTEEAERDLLLWESGFKGSLEYKTVLDHLISQILYSILPEDDLILHDQVIYSAEQIRKALVEDYGYLPLFKRLDQLKKIMNNLLKAKKKTILQKIAEGYEDQIETIIYQIRDQEIRRPLVIKLMDEKEAVLQKVEQASKHVIKLYMDRFPKQDVFDYYLSLFREHRELFDDVITDPIKMNYIGERTIANLKNKRYEIEDTAALLYLQHQLFGDKTKMKVRTVVIDEAQDFSVFQLQVLRTILDTDMFTILGDLAQGIHAYRGIQEWNELMSAVFPEKNGQLIELKQSYRTTVEIMSLANEVIRQSDTPGLILAEPVVRHGDKPEVIVAPNNTELINELIEAIERGSNDGLNSVAIITKSETDGKKLKKQLDKASKRNYVLITGKEEMKPSLIPIIPSYTVKGLEFDAVFIVALDEQFTLQETDLKLLYVSMTRPLHRLKIFTKKNGIQPFKNVGKTFYSKRGGSI
jgi:DNA helicase-2/ATP-dependent DNA helicase PcrA